MWQRRWRIKFNCHAWCSGKAAYRSAWTFILIIFPLQIRPFWMEFLGKSLGFCFGAHLFIRPFGALKFYFLTTYTSQCKIQKFRNLLETPSLWKKHVGELCNPGVWTTEFAWVVGRERDLSVWMGWFVQQIIFESSSVLKGWNLKMPFFYQLPDLLGWKQKWIEGENLHVTQTSLGNWRGIVQGTRVHTSGGFDHKWIELMIILNAFWVIWP